MTDERTKCVCGSEDVDLCAGGPEDEEWTSQCNPCRRIWGVKRAPQTDDTPRGRSHLYAFSHSSAEVKALEAMGG